MSRRPHALSTTAYAILGLLAIRSWTAYELAQQVRRSLRFCWPKSESLIYAEPKHLLRLGLATVEHEPAGRRTRARYAITPAGRQVLRDWLETPPAPPQLEFEGLLRIMFADQGSPEQALAALEPAVTYARALLEQGAEQCRDYLATGGPFPQRRHITALIAAFAADFLLLVERWSRLAAAEVKSWPDIQTAGLTPGARQSFEQVLTSVEASAAAQQSHALRTTKRISSKAQRRQSARR
jgi:PadR family transcriptional regulator, regulatory protein AphA